MVPPSTFLKKRSGTVAHLSKSLLLRNLKSFGFPTGGKPRMDPDWGAARQSRPGSVRIRQAMRLHDPPAHGCTWSDRSSGKRATEHRVRYGGEA
jgi:hypothetical protein